MIRSPRAGRSRDSNDSIPKLPRAPPLFLLHTGYESGRRLGVEYKGRKVPIALGRDHLRDEQSPLLWQKRERAMKVKSVLAVLGIAGATMALTLGILVPGRVDAVDQADGVAPVIAQTELTVEGCVFVAKLDKATYQAGDRPTLRVEATNQSGQPVETGVWLGVSGSAPLNQLSRMPPRPGSLWGGRCTVSLKPGETKTVTIPTDAELAAGQIISIVLSDQDLTVTAAERSAVPKTAESVPIPVRVNSSAQLALQQ